MKKFDFFNQFRDSVIVVKNYDNVVFKNNTFCRVFNKFTDIKRFAHKINFEFCPLDSENVDLYSPIFQAITSKENYFARISYTNNSGQTFHYDMTTVKRGEHTIFFFTDVSPIILLEKYEKETQIYQRKIWLRKLIKASRQQSSFVGVHRAVILPIVKTHQDRSQTSELMQIMRR
jgi:hypothetical protein